MKSHYCCHQDDLARDVKILDGESEAVFPISKRVMNFTRKNKCVSHLMISMASHIRSWANLICVVIILCSADSTNQLEDMVDYFEERYQVLGVQVR